MAWIVAPMPACDKGRFEGRGLEITRKFCSDRACRDGRDTAGVEVPPPALL